MYFLIYFTLVKFSLIEVTIKKYRKFLCVFAGTLLFLFAALRGFETGADYNNYSRLYDNFSTMSFEEKKSVLTMVKAEMRKFIVFYYQFSCVE